MSDSTETQIFCNGIFIMGYLYLSITGRLGFNSR